MKLSFPLRLAIIGALSLGLTATAALLLVGGQARAAASAEKAPVALREQVTVDAAVVTLDDVFVGLGAEGTRVIARAPNPGRRATLDARWLWRTARAHGLDWRPLSRHDTVTIERASTVVTAEDIRAQLMAALDARVSPGDDVELELDNPGLTVHLPVDAEERLQVSRLEFDPRSGRVRAVLSGARQRISVSGKIHRLAETPVPTRRLGIGHIVRERDLQWITVRASALDRNVITDELMIVGQAARRPLAEGRPIRNGDVEPPLLVQRKGMVTITLETPRMVLTAQGRALEDGALGDVIRIENTQSRRTIDATVTGPNAVTVTSAHQMYLQKERMMTDRTRTFRPSVFVAAVLAGTMLSGCNMLDRLSNVGSEPPITDIQNPLHDPNYRQVSLPMPAPETPNKLPNSLWRPGSRSFFKDLRASEVGDIVTVIVSIDDKAELDNATTRTRDTAEDASASALLGYEDALNDILPEAVDPTNLLDVDSDSNYSGDGLIDREEEINLKLAAVVTQVLPNGNLVIQGRQEIRVNYEVRELTVMGVIRPQDVDTKNQVQAEDIAEARISYGGRGTLSEVQQQRYGTQLIDILFPF